MLMTCHEARRLPVTISSYWVPIPRSTQKRSNITGFEICKHEDWWYKPNKHSQTVFSNCITTFHILGITNCFILPLYKNTISSKILSYRNLLQNRNFLRSYGATNHHSAYKLLVILSQVIGATNNILTTFVDFFKIWPKISWPAAKWDPNFKISLYCRSICKTNGLIGKMV